VAGALRDRASQDTVRRVHLKSDSGRLISSIISSLTPECEGVQTNCVESLLLWTHNGATVDLSNFFSRYRFPKLQRLQIYNCEISSWDGLRSKTGAITDLDLSFSDPTPTPTTAELLSIFTSNPLLQKIRLPERLIPKDDHDVSLPPVPLKHLKHLELTGYPHHVIGLLHRLDHPATLDRLSITFNKCMITDISQIIGPYLRNNLQHRRRFKGGLGIDFSKSNPVELRIGNAGGIHPEAVLLDNVVELIVPLDRDRLEEAALELIMHTPLEKVVYYQARGRRPVPTNIYSRLPNLRTLDLRGAHLSDVFPDTISGKSEGVLPSLQNLILLELVDNNDWDPLINFLGDRIDCLGKRLKSLKITYTGEQSLDTNLILREMVESSFECRGISSFFIPLRRGRIVDD
jgi:hypothetical protein